MHDRRGEIELLARVEQGVTQHRHHAREALGGPRLECGFDQWLAAKMNRRLHAPTPGCGRRSALHVEAEGLQPFGLAQGGTDDRARICAGNCSLAELLFDISESA